MPKQGSVMIVPLGDRAFDRSAPDALRSRGWRALVARNWRWAVDELRRGGGDFDCVLISATDRLEAEAFVAAMGAAASPQGDLPPLLVYALDAAALASLGSRAEVHDTVGSTSAGELSDAVGKAAAVARARRHGRGGRGACECGSRFNSGFHSVWCPAAGAAATRRGS